MSLASRLCLVVVLLCQGGVAAQDAKLLSVKLPLCQQKLVEGHWGSTATGATPHTLGRGMPFRPFPRRVPPHPNVWGAAPYSRGGPTTRPPTTRTSLPCHSPEKASRVISPSLSLRNFEVDNTSAAKPRESRLRPRLYWSMGLALAAGGAAWWSGHRADRAYDKYLHSAGRQRQDEQFRRAERYDRLAGGAFVFMEAGIVLTTYLVFF